MCVYVCALPDCLKPGSANTRRGNAVRQAGRVIVLVSATTRLLMVATLDLEGNIWNYSSSSSVLKNFAESISYASRVMYSSHFLGKLGISSSLARWDLAQRDRLCSESIRKEWPLSSPNSADMG